MSIVRVSLKKESDCSYDIIIEEGVGKVLARKILASGFGKRHCIVTDSNVQKTLGKELLKQFSDAGADACLVAFPAGEEHKTLSSVELVLDKMIAHGFDRKGCVVCLGGGVVGDVAGFAASVYLRGINFVHVPTTLLAMIDSSIGGKTGVNLSMGKNSAGTFSQPKGVFICPEFLQGLPKPELRNGLSEAVKTAVILDNAFFGYLEKNSGKAIALDSAVIAEIIERNCRLKAGIIEKDATEANYRRILNFGHTIGHAIEVLGNYTALKHGEAVSIGMVAEAEVSRKMGMMGKGEVERLRSLLKGIGLPVCLPEYDSRAILSATRKDKKTIGGKVHYALPESIGKMHSVNGSYGIPVEDKVVLAALEECA